MSGSGSVAMDAAGFLAALTDAGYDITVNGSFAIFPYAVEVGREAGRVVRIGLATPSDWPLSAPPGPHVCPRLGHADGAVHGSDLGPDWEYWSRPATNWARDRGIRAYLTHLRTLFARQ